MGRSRVAAYRKRIRTKFEAAFAETHPPHDIAASFAVGVFITTLPTFGVGLLVFLLLVALSDRVSKLALFASVVVFNPVVKWGVYALSFWLGTQLLGLVSGGTAASVSVSRAPEVFTRVLAGNLVLAVVFSVVGYVVMLKLVREYRSREVDIVEVLPDSVLE